MRSSWKLPFIPKVFNKKNILFALNYYYLNNNNLRCFTIPSTLINEEVYIHNGRFSTVITIIPKMVGHKLGEFSVTKSLGKAFRVASEKKKRKKKRKK